jgi:Na+/H+ antiporter NhaA
MLTTRAGFWLATTARARRVETPLREFLRTESGGAAVLLAATVTALVWVNVDASSYEQLWERLLAIHLDGEGVELTLREWVNSGLMTFFFFVLGLEARREFDLGDFRERRRFVLPLLASVGGMGSAAAIYLAFNLGSSTAEGWGIAMSTDRHGVRAGIAHAVRSARSGPPAGVHAHGRHRGRPARACRDSARL